MATAPAKPSASTSSRPGFGRLWHVVAASLFLAVTAHGVVLLWGPVDVLGGELYGVDSYTRLVRVEQLHHTGDWQDSRLHRVNPPDGLQQHWTRPLDAVLLAGAVALAPALGFAPALHLWAVVVPPLLHLLTLAGLVWGAAAVLDWRRLLLVGCLGVVQPLLLGNFYPGRADHDALLLCLLALAMACTLRLLYAPSGRRALGYGVAAGAAMATAVWTSAEAMVPVFGLVLACGLLWLAPGRRAGRPGLPAAMAATGAAALAVAAAGLVVEYEPGRIAAEPLRPDRLSLFHAGSFAVLTAFWLALRAVGRRWPATVATGRRRLGLGGALGALGAGLLLAAFPGLVTQPWLPMDAFYLEHRFRYILEYQPVIAAAGGGAEMLWQVGRGMLRLGVPLAALVYAGCLACSAGQGEARAAWLVLAVTAGVTAAVLGALDGLSWHDLAYLQLLLAIPYADLIVRAGRAVGRGLRVAVVAALVAWPAAGAAALAPGTGGGGQGGAACEAGAIARRIDGLGLASRPAIILAPAELAPELLYRTPHGVLSIPSHRPHAGFRDMVEAFAAGSAERARRIVDRRSVELVVVCRAYDWAFARAGGGESFHRRLLRGDAPAWLEPIEPGPAAAGARLYRVRRAPG